VLNPFAAQEPSAKRLPGLRQTNGQQVAIKANVLINASYCNKNRAFAAKSLEVVMMVHVWINIAPNSSKIGQMFREDIRIAFIQNRSHAQSGLIDRSTRIGLRHLTTKG
jgi:hypothetical protein